MTALSPVKLHAGMTMPINCTVLQLLAGSMTLFFYDPNSSLHLTCTVGTKGKEIDLATRRGHNLQWPQES